MRIKENDQQILELLIVKQNLLVMENMHTDLRV